MMEVVMDEIQDDGKSGDVDGGNSRKGWNGLTMGLRFTPWLQHQHQHQHQHQLHHHLLISVLILHHHNHPRNACRWLPKAYMPTSSIVPWFWIFLFHFCENSA
jgi:hypothetical protein